MEEQMPLKCLRCGGRMEEGYMLERAPNIELKVSEWVEGRPEKSFWVGLNLRHRNRLPIMTYRCEKCGWLESYAL